MRGPPSKDKDTDTPSLIADMEVNHNLTLGCVIYLCSIIISNSCFTLY